MFGSQAAGLAMADSDIDVVILSVVGGRPDGECDSRLSIHLEERYLHTSLLPGRSPPGEKIVHCASSDAY